MNTQKRTVSFCQGLLGRVKEEVELGGIFVLKVVLGISIKKTFDRRRRYFYDKPEREQNLKGHLGIREVGDPARHHE